MATRVFPGGNVTRDRRAFHIIAGVVENTPGVNQVLILPQRSNITEYRARSPLDCQFGRRMTVFSFPWVQERIEDRNQKKKTRSMRPGNAATE